MMEASWSSLSEEDGDEEERELRVVVRERGDSVLVDMVEESSDGRCLT